MEWLEVFVPVPLLIGVGCSLGAQLPQWDAFMCDGVLDL